MLRFFEYRSLGLGVQVFCTSGSGLWDHDALSPVHKVIITTLLWTEAKTAVVSALAIDWFRLPSGLWCLRNKLLKGDYEMA